MLLLSLSRIIMHSLGVDISFSLSLSRSRLLVQDVEREGEKQVLSYFCFAVLHHHCLVSFLFLSLALVCTRRVLRSSAIAM